MCYHKEIDKILGIFEKNDEVFLPDKRRKDSIVSQNVNWNKDQLSAPQICLVCDKQFHVEVQLLRNVKEEQLHN